MSKNVNGVVIHADGTYSRKQFKQLSDYQQAVGGLIEPVRLLNHTYEEIACMYVNEEGLLIGLPFNERATKLSFLFQSDNLLVGDAVIIGASDEEGDDTDIPEWLAKFIENTHEEAKVNV